ncbi:hypothetical protein FOA52_007965 [Chlamydomonas sp. UWO 241]|nr:hypothetical protein FOA52_007965 [Chlamydomonas sp. UWO 241]
MGCGSSLLPSVGRSGIAESNGGSGGHAHTPSSKPWEMQHSRASVAVRCTDHVSQCAVSLKWIEDSFLAQHPEILARNMTTGEVVTSIVQTETSEKRTRYVANLMWGDNAAPAAVSHGRNFYFISHGWSRPFPELIEMLRKHFSPEQQRVWRQGQPILTPAQVFIWLDIFAINQHPGEGQRGDLNNLKEVLADADQTLMCLDHKGAVLTRIWCLYEAWQSQRKGRGRLVIMSYDIKLEPLQQVFLELDVASAEATQREDLDRILAEIDSDVGTHAMTHDLKNALVASSVAEVPAEAQWAPELGYKLEKAAQLLQLYGRLDEAEQQQPSAPGHSSGRSPCRSSVHQAPGLLPSAVTTTQPSYSCSGRTAEQQQPSAPGRSSGSSSAYQATDPLPLFVDTSMPSSGAAQSSKAAKAALVGVSEVVNAAAQAASKRARSPPGKRVCFEQPAAAGPSAAPAPKPSANPSPAPSAASPKPTANSPPAPSAAPPPKPSANPSPAPSATPPPKPSANPSPAPRATSPPKPSANPSPPTPSAAPANANATPAIVTSGPKTSLTPPGSFYGGPSTHDSPAFVTHKGKGSVIEAIKIREASAGIGQRITRSITRPDTAKLLLKEGGYAALSDRILVLRFRPAGAPPVTAVIAYAPTDAADDVVAKDAFYEQLHRDVISQTPSNHFLLVLGDFNAKITAASPDDHPSPLYRRDLEGRKAILGLDHESTIICMNNLASLLYAMGKYDDSGKMYQQAEVRDVQ